MSRRAVYLTRDRALAPLSVGDRGCRRRIFITGIRVSPDGLVAINFIPLHRRVIDPNALTEHDGQEFWNSVEYHEIVPHEKIVSLMYFSDSKGNKIDPAQLGIEHEAIEGAYDVTIFEDLGNGQTKLTFIKFPQLDLSHLDVQVPSMFIVRPLPFFVDSYEPLICSDRRP